MKLLVTAVLGALAFAGCGTPKVSGYQAVGTYIGGGSVLTGPDDCAYEAEPTVLEGDSRTARGPRLVVGEGEILRHCGKDTYVYRAVKATEARIEGPDSIKGDGSYHVSLWAGKEALEAGDAPVEWQLSKDCDGIADFGPVMGAQDTGGPDRHRTLVGKKAGKCQITAIVETRLRSGGRSGVQAAKLVTIQ